MGAAPAIGEWLWEIEPCRGSLDCWTAYAGRKVSPEAHWNGHLRRYRIIKRTPRRIYLTDCGRTYVVDRTALDANGSVRSSRLYAELYAAEPSMPDGWGGWHTSVQLKALKAEAVAVHPDRGGDSAEFRAAWARYGRARERAVS